VSKEHDERIAEGLTKVFDRRADSEARELSELRAVVFSDHHRGIGDGADDFCRCEGAYCAALGWYLERGYELWLLGDVEELWENRPKHVIERYGDVLALERAFGDRLRRCFGNHDMAWRSRRNVRRFLRSHLPRPKVAEALKLTITDAGKPLGTLFLVHGHQGTWDSGNLLVVPFSRFFVRFFWARVQRAQGFASTSPSTSNVLRAKHDRAMARWADRHPERIVMVAGHTHRPVLPGSAPADVHELLDQRQVAYDAAQGGPGAPGARAELERARVDLRREEPYEPPDLERPCYLNTGCCSFGDGDVTGLEFSGGQVRLVRWLDDDGAAKARELGTPLDLRAMFATVAGSVPAASD
jgi:UDP-2,3-diacylglucosamine pyrophosphatase LpxH